MVHRLRPLLIAALLLAGCGARSVLDTVDGLSEAERARLVAFDARIDADHLPALLPPEARQRVDVRPGSVVDSGLARYLPVLDAELADALADFERQSGIAPLRAFERLVLWSDAPTVDAMTEAGRRSELIFALDGATLTRLVEWIDGGGPSRLAGEAPPAEPPPADEGFDAGLFVAAFGALDAGQLAAVRAVMARDAARVESLAVGPAGELVTARGTDDDGPWTMWAFTWPGGLLTERATRIDLTDRTVALRRLAAQLDRIERAADAAARPLPPDRVVSARIAGPHPIAFDLDMGQTVGLRLTAPVEVFELDMPPQVLVAAWPTMKVALIGGLEQHLSADRGLDGFGPLIAGAIRASTLGVTDGRLTFATTLSRLEFESLLPTL